MKNHHKKKQRQVPVTDKKTGATEYRDAPEIGRNLAIKIDETVTHSAEVSSMVNVGTEPSNAHIATDSKAAEKKQAETLEQFIEAYFTGKVKTLSNDRVRKLKKHIFDGDRRDQLVILAIKNDISLELSRRLLTMLEQLGAYSSFQHTVSDFVRDAVMRHPIMVPFKAELWFPLHGEPDEAHLNELYESIGTGRNVKAETKPDEGSESDGARKSASDLQRARLNAFFLAVIWRYSKKTLSFSELVRVLRSTAYKAESDDIEGGALDYLMSTQAKDRSSVAILMQWYTEQADYDRNAAETARRRSENLQQQLDESKQFLVLAQNDIEGLKEEVAGLRIQLDAAHEKERVQGIHMRADQQSQKGRTLRILEEEIPILGDCLKALERDPPKVEVAKHLMGSALEKLSNELSELKGGE